MPNAYLIAVEAAQNCDLSDLRELHEYIGLLLRDREQEAADEATKAFLECRDALSATTAAK